MTRVDETSGRLWARVARLLAEVAKWRAREAVQNRSGSTIVGRPGTRQGGLDDRGSKADLASRGGR
jgi:hypothetical protein